MAIGLSHEAAPPRPAEPPDPRRQRARHPLATVLVVAVIVLLAAFVGWIGIRGYLARQALYAALPDVGLVRDAVQSGDLGRAEVAAGHLREHAATAAALTDDPIWRFAEGLPWVGPDLAAARTIAATTDTVADRVVRPLVAVASSVDPRGIRLSAGAIDLAPLVAAQPTVEKAQSAFHDARAELAAVDTGAIVEPVRSAVERMRGILDETAPAVDAVGNTARLLPGMLGAGGRRDYLLVAQNPAELRATGGLIGSVALIRADHGSIALVTQQAGSSIGPWGAPVADIPAATQGLYGPLVGRYLQDVNYTPDFPLAARTAAAMWRTTHGSRVDGVIALDPVVLSALLRATGPVPLATGDTIGADNAVPLLLSGVYRRYAAPVDQDAFFSSAAAAVFQRVAAGGASASALVPALAASGTSGRILVWSAHPDEQEVLAGTTLAGGLPVSTAETAGLGVYFDDATGAKMGYYLQAQVSAGSVVCRADGTPTAEVRVTLANRAPADAGSTLPDYVTGAGRYGVHEGSILTRVVVYGPAGGLLAGVTSGGSRYPAVTGTDRARPVAVAEVLLAPGESRAVEVEFLAVRQTGTGLSVAVTPTLPGDGTTPDVGSRPAVGAIAGSCSAGVN